MLLTMDELLSSRQLLFVGGKGGVGKTTSSAALALRAAASGRRCLVVSTDPAHSLGDIFERPVGGEETPLVDNLWGLEIDPRAEADAYIDGVKQSMRGLVHPRMYGEIDRQMELARHSPGAEEAALLDRMTALMDEGLQRYDLMLFDTAPTGHTLRLLSLPEVMAAWTDGMLRQRDRTDELHKAFRALHPAEDPGTEGRREPSTVRSTARGSRARDPGDELSWIDREEEAATDPRAERIRRLLLARRRKFHRARRLLLDHDVTAFLLVLNPEKLPILESRQALRALRRFHVPVGGLIVNRILPPEATGAFFETRRAQEQEYLAEIDETFSNLPRWRVPLLARDVRGLTALRRIADHLAASRPPG